MGALKQMITQQDEMLKQNLQQISHNQELIMKHQNIIVDDNYLQYITIKNLFYFVLAVSTIATCIWLYNLDLFNTSTIQSIQKLSTIVEQNTNTLNTNTLNALTKIDTHITQTSEKQIDILYKIFNNANNELFSKEPILKQPVFPQAHINVDSDTF
jgi:hypothetical protein